MKSFLLLVLTFSVLIMGFGFIEESSEIIGIKKSEVRLGKILEECANYCKKLANTSFYFVCKEEIVETFVPLNLKIGRRRRTIYDLLTPRDRRLLSQFTEINSYVYDYQLIHKNNKIHESRILIKENGLKKNEKNADLKTKLFRHEYIVFGPIGLLSHSAQHLHDYKIIEEGDYKGKKVIILEAIPKAISKDDHLNGKVWIEKTDFSILKIEWSQKFIKNYGKVEEVSKQLKAKPEIKIISEFGIEKKGLRFLSNHFIEEAYLVPGYGKFVRSKKTVRYNDYKFFTVETEIKY